MHIILRLFAGLALAMSLHGCAFDASEARVTPEYAVTVKKVGVVSLVDAAPNLSFLRASAQESRFTRLTLPGWQADALVHEAVLPRLRRKGFEVSVIAPDDALRRANGDDWGGPGNPALFEAAYALGAAHGLDTMVIIARDISPDVVTDTNQNIRGYGLQRAFDSEAHAYAIVHTSVLDIARRFVVGQARGVQQAPLPAGVWQAAFEDAGSEPALPPAMLTTVDTMLRQLLGAAIGVSVQEAGL